MWCLLSLVRRGAQQAPVPHDEVVPLVVEIYSDGRPS
jgi:hypothetical protein